MMWSFACIAFGFLGLVIYCLVFTKYLGVSFNGRTAVSKTANVGSIPTAPAHV